MGFGAVQVAAAQSSSGSGVSMRTLLQRGFEIKAAAPNGSQYVVFLQKGKAAYACEFKTLTSSRCGAINSESE
ncbi:hypothetical protein OQ273_06685 [Hoeflea prorocentri]|uniref:Uncharacterized protein n=2 Tax=Hoeflea prorocentri TaxID=1922333 RepID=A0A9X3UGX5_9HYPH|nr:hypothetical protein [Hoeflea prorocentri]MCY6380456.1 hypothetical protein [Hoeflea prorocentri]MDA5398256.1 hypothetical protein [Hoeflea prorocentri]